MAQCVGAAHKASRGGGSVRCLNRLGDCRRSRAWARVSQERPNDHGVVGAGFGAIGVMLGGDPLAKRQEVG